jgi:flagellar hook-associated protein 2
LNALADAINASGANVQATVVNVGSSSAPDYRLSVQSLQYAPDTIQLSDSSNTDLLNTISTGSYVQYQVNGQPATPIDSTTRTVTISPGLTLNLLKAGTATVSVSQSTAGLSTAVSSFVSAYNAVADELTKNRGQNGGPLAGESIVYQLQNVLRNLAQYAAPSGNLGALASLGISFDNTGHLQFDQATFGQTAPNDVLNFFGSEAGSGFLQAASNALTEVNDSTNGLLPQATQATISEISSIGAKISSDQDTVNQLQTSLTQQMSAADAAIASLEQQVSQITALFAAMQQESRNFTS